ALPIFTLIPETNDSSFTWAGFEAKVNNELANNIGNFINRSLKFFEKNWNEGIDGETFQGFFKSTEIEKIKNFFSEYHKTMDSISLKKGLELVMKLVAEANTYFSDSAPWAQIKEDENKAKETIAYSSIYAFVLGVVFEPFLPTLSKNILSHFE